MSPLKLKRIRVAILPAAALAAAGVTIWLDITRRGSDVNRDDLCPAVLTIILSVWALLAHFYRKYFRETGAAAAQVQHSLPILAEGVAAVLREKAAGDGQRAPGPRTGS